MGAWGTGAFENDDGLDWIGDFCDEPGEERLRAALDAAAGADGYLESPDAASALAAAEVVAALNGAPTSDPIVTEDYLPIIVRMALPVTADLRALALRAIDRITTDSELKELWEEVDSTPWYTEVAALRDRVAGRQ